MATPAPMVVLELSQLPTIGGSGLGTSACSMLYDAAFRDIPVDDAPWLVRWDLARWKKEFISDVGIVTNSRDAVYYLARRILTEILSPTALK